MQDEIAKSERDLGDAVQAYVRTAHAATIKQMFDQAKRMQDELIGIRAALKFLYFSNCIDPPLAAEVLRFMRAQVLPGEIDRGERFPEDSLQPWRELLIKLRSNANAELG